MTTRDQLANGFDQGSLNDGWPEFPERLRTLAKSARIWFHVAGISLIETRRCKSAAEFIAALRRSDPHWLPDRSWDVPWVFRGEAFDDKSLLPSAWRADARAHEMYIATDATNIDDVVSGLISDEQNKGIISNVKREAVRALIIQRRFEYQVAATFASLVNQLGLAVPGDRLLEPPKDQIFEWSKFNDRIHDVYALGQHHGMPTRLLDWTYNPLVAAFFAADKSVDHEAENIVVWALDCRRLKPMDCRTFSVPRSQIGFLHAQEGLFTYLPSADWTFLKTGSWPSVEDSVPRDALQRIMLPKSEVPPLMRLLWAEQISKAHLMPTLDNVTHALKQSWKIALSSGTMR